MIRQLTALILWAGIPQMGVGINNEDLTTISSAIHKRLLSSMTLITDLVTGFVGSGMASS